MAKQNEKAFYPLDLAGIRRMGLGRWRETYAFPLPGAEFPRIHDIILKAFVERAPAEDVESPLYWTVVINYKLVHGLAQACYEYKIARRLKEMGYQSAGGVPPIAIDDLITQRKTAWPFKHTAFNWKRSELWRERARTVRGNWGHHSPLKTFLGGVTRASSHLIGERDAKETRAYIEANNLNPVNLRPPLFFTKGMKRLPREYGDPVIAFAKGVTASIRAADPTLGDFFDDAFQSALEFYLLVSLIAFLNARDKLAKRGSLGPLLMTNIGNLHYRAFAAAWRSAGGETIGFTHGNPYPYAYVPSDSVNGSHRVCSKYIVMSEGEKTLLEASRRDFPTGFESNETIEVCPGSMPREMFARLSNAGEPVKTVKTVMVIGYPMELYYSALLPEVHVLSSMWHELRIIEDLKRAGYEVIYKAHPDTLSQTSDIYGPLADKLEGRPFESVYGDADCLLLPFPFSTTMGFSLMTNRPLVIMSDIGRSYWHPDVLPLLKKRCSIVNLSSNKAGRIVYDPNDLIKAVAESANKMDYAIVKEYGI